LMRLRQHPQKKEKPLKRCFSQEASEIRCERGLSSLTVNVSSFLPSFSLP
jgi:hypothetical protein